MNISDFQPDGIRVREAQLDRPEKAPVKRDEGWKETPPDRVQMSPLSEALLQKLDSTSRVEALKSAYESGAYRVNPETLAKSLIEAHLQLPKGQINESAE